MSVLWILPLLVIAAGAVAIAATARHAAEATIALQEECSRLEELRLALAGVRGDTAAVRLQAKRVGSRGGRGESAPARR